MQRRSMVAALMGVALTVPSAVQPQISRQGCYRGHDNLVRCSTGFTDPPPIPAQECRALCWATCLAYVARGFGAALTTGDVLARHGLGHACVVHRDPARLAASVGFWTDREGREFLLEVSPVSGFHSHAVRGTDFRETLSRLERQPLLCGAAGHTTVVTEIETSADRFGRVWRDRVRVLDPFLPQRGLRDLTEEELAQPAYVLAVSIRAL